jgi:hypothetical protein
MYVYLYTMCMETTLRRLVRCVCIFINYDIYIYRAYRGHCRTADVVGIYIFIYYCNVMSIHCMYREHPNILNDLCGVHSYIFVIYCAKIGLSRNVHAVCIYIYHLLYYVIYKYRSQRMTLGVACIPIYIYYT